MCIQQLLQFISFKTYDLDIISEIKFDIHPTLRMKWHHCVFYVRPKKKKSSFQLPAGIAFKNPNDLPLQSRVYANRSLHIELKYYLYMSVARHSFCQKFEITSLFKMSESG